MNVLTYLVGLRPAIPMSIEKPCKETSNGELIRWCKNGNVIINGKAALDSKAPVDCPVESLVFFPKSKKRRTTLV